MQRQQYGYGTSDWDIYLLVILKNYNLICFRLLVIQSFVVMYVNWLKAIGFHIPLVLIKSHSIHENSF